MFVSPPILVLRRTIMLRLLLGLVVLPFGLLSLWGLVAALTSKPPDTVGAGMCAVLAAAFLIPFWYFFRRELGRQTRIHNEGVAQVIGARTTELPWSAIREVWFEAVTVQAGGVLGAAVGAAIGAATKRKAARLDPNTTNITVRLVGSDGTKLSLTSNDKGVVEAFEEVLPRVCPRLLAEATRQVQQGQPVAFGPVSISQRGVATGRKDPVGYSEIETFGIQGGKLRLKKRGTWLDVFAVPIKNIPNVFVLTDLYAYLSAAPPDQSRAGVGAHLSSSAFV